MHKGENKKSIIVVTSMLIVLAMLFGIKVPVNAEVASVNPIGKLYSFDEKSKYEIDSTEAKEEIQEGTRFGKISLTGDFIVNNEKNGFASYVVNSGCININYNLNGKFKNTDEKKWHIKDDDVKTVNNTSLDGKIKSGVVYVQTSLDGEKWVTDSIYLDVNSEKAKYVPDIYSTNQLQQSNGCYVRVIVAYKIEKEISQNKILFVKTKEYKYKKYAEVYSFYVENKNGGNTVNAEDGEKQILGEVVKTEKDKGYTGELKIEEKDPHYGWVLGHFTVNGFTQKNEKEGKYEFVKNSGDQVSLWFTLDQDINKLDNNENYVINEDKDGYDQKFQTKKTNFKRGALIVRFTDTEGVKHDPQIYTNYLEASTRTGADTKIDLNEEGTYEVALDYEIKDKTGISSTTDYRIALEFAVKNGNSMGFFFDKGTGAELYNNYLTENGIRLDLANSKYLKVNYTRQAIKFNGEKVTLDTRENKVARDGQVFDEEGIYTFTITSEANGAEGTSKTIFVGDSPFLKAIYNGRTVEEINDKIASGYSVNEDGTLSIKVTETVVKEESKKNMEVVEEQEVEKKTVSIVPFIIIIIIIVAGVLGVYTYKRKNIILDNANVEEEKTNEEI